MRGSEIRSFAQELDYISKKKDSKVILALDIEHRRNTSRLLRDAERIVTATSGYITAVKINYHLLLPLSVSDVSHLNSVISKEELVSIADLKLNDIANTNMIACDYLWDEGFSAVIVNPFVGYEGGLDEVFERARRINKGVITLAYMSHKGADEGYGLKLSDGRTVFDEFLRRAAEWRSSGVVLGTTRPEKISAARKTLDHETKIICPGSGSQGGDVKSSLKAGADYLIFGRTIVNSSNPEESARKISRLIRQATN